MELYDKHFRSMEVNPGVLCNDFEAKVFWIFKHSVCYISTHIVSIGYEIQILEEVRNIFAGGVFFFSHLWTYSSVFLTETFYTI